MVYAYRGQSRYRFAGGGLELFASLQGCLFEYLHFHRSQLSHLVRMSLMEMLNVSKRTIDRMSFLEMIVQDLDALRNLFFSLLVLVKLYVFVSAAAG